MAEENEGIKDINLADIGKECLDSEGYVVFAAFLSNKTDTDGNRLLEFRYRRYHFGFEDLKSAVIAFRKEYKKEVEEGLDSDLDA